MYLMANLLLFLTADCSSSSSPPQHQKRDLVPEGASSLSTAAAAAVVDVEAADAERPILALILVNIVENE